MDNLNWSADIAGFKLTQKQRITKMACNKQTLFETKSNATTSINSIVYMHSIDMKIITEFDINDLE
jgi:hypothetical protein